MFSLCSGQDALDAGLVRGAHFAPMSHADILDKLGGYQGVSTALGMPLQRVRFWHRRNCIPVRYWREVIDLGKLRGVRITHARLAETMPQGEQDAEERFAH
jgi:hypothetical protein